MDEETTNTTVVDRESLLAGLRAAAEPTRLRILTLCRQGDLTVTDLTRLLGQSQPRVSRHLKLLCEAGLLERYQEGTWAFFHVPAQGGAAALAKSVVGRIAADDTTLLRDTRRLEDLLALRAGVANAYFSDNAATWDHLRSLHVDEAEVEAALLDMMPEGGVETLLDIGTGTGRMLQLFGPYAGTALGVDRSRDMLAVARTNLEAPEYRNCALRQADMNRLPIEDGAFEMVISHMVLHYADRPADVIGEAARVLAPGGQFLIVDFAPHAMEELRAEHAHRRLGFRSEEIVSWCADSGLDLVEERRLDGDPLTVTIWRTRPVADVLPISLKTAAGKQT